MGILPMRTGGTPVLRFRRGGTRGRHDAAATTRPSCNGGVLIVACSRDACAGRVRSEGRAPWYITLIPQSREKGLLVE
jgi:hypothetical protein